MSWTSNPYILMDREHIGELWPTQTMSYNTKFNAITRLVVVLSVLGFLVTKSLRFLAVGLVSLGVMVALYAPPKAAAVPEGFTVSTDAADLSEQPLKDFTNPTIANPLMNVLLPEINGNPDRKQAAPSFNPVIETQINECVMKQNKIDPRLFRGMKNQYDLDLAMRQFNTNPSTTVPNKQDEFAQFCYGDMISAKEGNPFALERNAPRLGSVNY